MLRASDPPVALQSGIPLYGRFLFSHDLGEVAVTVVIFASLFARFFV
ncbi:hypothetical protein JOE60_002447 [Paenarthrobacter ilicis]|uniref:Uncharacterized protein n=1 Tax=Paenarthrobacter ilicis TaxID=43665 RepID=A0ABX0TFR9_9MICC|nr:hypothetical protein [Paenarthrobacter ilicis]NIJ00036.1 hypothetical protein [Paenarthrobacter ilicis]